MIVMNHQRMQHARTSTLLRAPMAAIRDVVSPWTDFDDSRFSCRCRETLGWRRLSML